MMNENLDTLITMPREPNRFLGSWLLKVAEAQSFWSEALRDPTFKDSVSALCSWREPDLDDAALEALRGWRHGDRRFNSYLVVGPEFVDSWDFAIMVQLGFFDESYQMTLPEAVTLEGVRQAALMLAATEKAEAYAARVRLVRRSAG
jgi:hypothetical protein